MCLFERKSIKTKKEIIDETAAAFTLSTRSVGRNYQCEYCCTDGRKCAVGRYMYTINTPGFFVGAVSLLRSASSQNAVLEEVLLPEYKGHELAFWQSVQRLHDNVYNWDADGLSPTGVEHRDALLVRWAE